MMNQWAIPCLFPLRRGNQAVITEVSGRICYRPCLMYRCGGRARMLRLTLGPRTVTPAAAKRIANAAKEGKIGSAWKQLWSYGIATPDERTAEAVQRKWAPPAKYPLPSHLPLAPSEVVNSILTQNNWKHALHRLKGGRAADAVGWTSNVFQTLSTSAELDVLLRRIMHDMMAGTLPPDIMKLMTASRLVALRKDARDGVRPIAVPAIWRKVASSMIVEHHKDDVTVDLGRRQFSIYVANGGAAFATRVQELAEASPHSLIIQCDMANAFGSVHRHALQQALQQCSGSLSQVTRAWLARDREHRVYGASGWAPA
eukprot:1524028-Amphidinium_carterae.3